MLKCVHVQVVLSMPAQKLVDRHSLKILNMEAATLPQNNSHQELMGGTDSDSVNSASVPSDDIDGETSKIAVKGRRGISAVTFRQWLTVIVLCFVNLINYMDRFTLAG